MCIAPPQRGLSCALDSQRGDVLHTGNRGYAPPPEGGVSTTPQVSARGFPKQPQLGAQDPPV